MNLQPRPVLNWLEGKSRWSFNFLTTDLISRIPGIHIRNSYEKCNIIISFSASQLRQIDNDILSNVVYIYASDREHIFGRTELPKFRTMLNPQEYSLEEKLQSIGAIIALNNSLFEKARSFNGKIFKIPNGLDLNYWKPNYIYPKTFTVGFAGNVLTPEFRLHKGFDLVQTACRNLNIPLLTAFYRNKQIKHENMLEDFYNKVSVLVLPTLSEGSSGVIMEAMACGVPVITTKTAGFHGEQLENGFNVLFVDRQVESIESAIATIRDNPQVFQMLSKSGRIFAEENHNIDRVAGEYSNIFESVYMNNNKSMVRLAGLAEYARYL